jgi:aryl-alcohol dehydrogenase-like predicted oxidoreductase
MMYEQEDKALEALNKALDLGITYIDTAHGYGGGKSEERIGKVMAQRRKEVVLATKIGARKGDDAMREIELSLKRLQTDHLDVMHIHALSTTRSRRHQLRRCAESHAEGARTENDAIHWHHLSRGSPIIKTALERRL